MRDRRALTILITFCMAILAAGTPTRAQGNDDDPPSRVARMGYVQGAVSFQPAGTDDWVDAVLNRPITTGDQLWTDRNGRAELQLDGSLVRLSNNTGFSFLNLDDNVTQIQLTSGTILVRVRRLDQDETYEIDTPNLAFTIVRPGVYRVSVDEDGNTTAIKVRGGAGQVTGEGAAYSLDDNDSYTFSGTDQLYADSENYGNDEDAFDGWAAERDRRWEKSESARYVSADVVGYEDLDNQGEWQPAGEYGNVWFPRTAEADWAPYRYGHWAYIEPWGYTWVDDEQWGFAPFHYGRWVSYRGRWGWVPAPPRVEGVVYVRPVYAPALVAWVGGPHFAVGVGVGGAGVNVGWFPLGPREVYVPSYRVSQRYVERVNVSNTRVTTVVVNNYYNTTIVNNNVNVREVRYVNQGVRGAVTATTPRAFTSAQPVARNVVRVDEREVAAAPVRAFTPAEAPVKQAVLGTGAAATARPPAVIARRTVVAKVAPPPPPPTFERRQEAIKNNGGKPLSVTQVRQIEPAAAKREAPVKVAPPPKTVAPAAQATKAPNRPPSQTGGNRTAEPTIRPGQTPGQAPVQAQAPTQPTPTNRPAAPGLNRPNEANPAQPTAPPARNAEADRKQQQEQQKAEQQRQQDQQKAQQQQRQQEQDKARQDQQKAQQQQRQQEQEKAQQDQQRQQDQQKAQQQQRQQEQEKARQDQQRQQDQQKTQQQERQQEQEKARQDQQRQQDSQKLQQQQRQQEQEKARQDQQRQQDQQKAQQQQRQQQGQKATQDDKQKQKDDSKKKPKDQKDQPEPKS
jgi:hypothetical protein